MSELITIPQHIGIIPELISIIVDPQHQGKKIGKKLIAEFEKTLKSRHHSAYFLIVGANNAPARQFYLSCGFREVGQVVSMGRQFVRLSKEVV
jgi:ribosomal protein S18 acetylase RimI-like enzyme